MNTMETSEEAKKILNELKANCKKIYDTFPEAKKEGMQLHFEGLRITIESKDVFYRNQLKRLENKTKIQTFVSTMCTSLLSMYEPIEIMEALDHLMENRDPWLMIMTNLKNGMDNPENAEAMLNLADPGGIIEDKFKDGPELDNFDPDDLDFDFPPEDNPDE